ncbi:DsbA family protein [Thalassotalea ganghwensis]
MKKLFVATLVLLTSACQTTHTDNQAQIDALQKEVEQLKHVQTLVAQKVGLGSLVRPDEISIENGHRIGSEDAKVVIIEFTDLHCPFCKKFHQGVWPELKKNYVDTGKVLFVGREFPLASLHPRAAFAAVTLRCGAKQGQYKEIKDYLFEKGQGLAKSDLEKIVADFALDETRFNACLKDPTVHNSITASLLDAKKLGLAKTPSFIIGKRNGNAITDYKIFDGAGTVQEFSTSLDELLAK